VSLEL